MSRRIFRDEGGKWVEIPFVELKNYGLFKIIDEPPTVPGSSPIVCRALSDPYENDDGLLEIQAVPV